MELYHVLNRGVDRRKIFQDNSDRARFVHDLWEFNDIEPAHNTSRTSGRQPMSNIVSRSSQRLVLIHGWCIMENHYHLLLSEQRENGISAFIRKLNVGYARYFNEKHDRTGVLFEGRTKRILIAKHAHFLHILHYIHLNPLDYLIGAEKWRERQLKNATAALEYLSGYRWSSYLDYCGQKNFPSILSTDLFGEVFGDYASTIREYVRDIELSKVQGLTLE